MEQYPQEVQVRIEILNLYEWDNELNCFDIIHLYPKELAYPNGYWEARFFKLIGFNTQTMTKRDLGKHDAIIYNDDIVVALSEIFADGSTLIKFKSSVKIDCEYFQAINFYSVK